jgi:hypothetical protein
MGACKSLPGPASKTMGSGFKIEIRQNMLERFVFARHHPNTLQVNQRHVIGHQFRQKLRDVGVIERQMIAWP